MPFVRTNGERSGSDGDERLVCALLAAHVAALRERIDDRDAVELLWRSMDLLETLSGLLDGLAREDPANKSDPEDRSAAALATASALARSIKEHAFGQAQRQDISRQMADLVVMGLERLAADTPAGVGLSPDDLALAYVCDEQRDIHDTVMRRATAEARDSKGT